MSNNKPDSNNSMLRYAGMATQWMVTLLAAVWIGLQLDKRTGWKFPLFTVLLPLLALVVLLWRLIKEFDKPKK